jgi:hypothetical protein
MKHTFYEFGKSEVVAEFDDDDNIYCHLAGIERIKICPVGLTELPQTKCFENCKTIKKYLEMGEYPYYG